MTTQLSTLAADGSQSQYTPSTAPSDDISSIRDDFTVLFAQTGLPPSLHRSRTTQTGFRLDDRRLGQYLPAPPIKEINPSWIWEYGERLCDETDPPVRYWLCHRCFDSKPSKFQINNISKLTSGALKHLELKHNLVKGQQKIPITPTKRKNPFELIVDRVERARLETINPDEWKARFINFEHVDVNDIDTEAADNKVRKFLTSVDSMSEEELLKHWRKKGFYGKAHNFVVYVNRSPQRIQRFKAMQREVDDQVTFLYSLLTDGGVRWNSAYAMFERLILLKDAVTLFQSDELETGDLEQQDLITSEDWRDMTEFKELLEPFKEATMRTQGRAHDGTYGALWEWLTELELLLTILENKREYLLDQPPSFLRTSVNLAWSKLSTYYELSDETFAYRLAIVMNPNYRYD
ncbi:hypothetical protein KCV03_g9084, partial [Aureobasidium melanogenum]